MDRVALVTGASRGIGRQIALSLSENGYHVVVNYASSPDRAEEVVACCRETGDGTDAIAVRGDVGIPEDRQGLIDATRDRFGRLDLLVNNAGITSIGRDDLLKAKEENFDRLFAVNLKGPYFLTQLAANWMIDQQKGSTPENYLPQVVTISSISAYTVSTNRGDYCMAKAALRMMTQLYAVRFAEHGIGVYEVCPGVIESDMTAPVKEKYDRLIAEGLWPIRRWGKPEDVAKAVVAISTGAFPFTTGEAISVDGGFHLRTL